METTLEAELEKLLKRARARKEEEAKKNNLRKQYNYE